MYILIDRENLTFVHKHLDHTVVSMLATIEVSHVATCIMPIEEKAFSGLTDLELRLLHKHTTGKKLEGIFLPKLIKELVEVALALPESDVIPFEVRQQAQKISPNDSGFYRYVKGSFSATRLQDLFMPALLTTDTPVMVKPVMVKPVAVPRAAPVRTTTAFKPVQPLPTWHPAYKSA
jgi:hypothetical protein